jgi:hypothetical protein
MTITNFSSSQTWKTIYMSDYTSLPQFNWENGNWPITLRLQHFKINPYDQSIWGFSDNNVYRVDIDGSIVIWDEGSTIFTVTAQEFNDICFTSLFTYVVTPYSGVFKYNGIGWNYTSILEKGINLASDKDTVWVARQNESYLKIVNATVSSNNSTVPNRIVSRNSELYFSSAIYYGALALQNMISYTYFDPTVDSYYLDYKNYDFKYTPKGDTLFTSGNRGFSIAVNGSFIDTLTQYNTINMPNSSITEFEFDKNNNIWAVFSDFSNAPQAQKIGFLDRSTNTWSQIYDESNSPIDFPRVTIELDSNGNVWVANRHRLHVLDINNAPIWLDTKDLHKEAIDFQISPNPIDKYLNISNHQYIESARITDVSGRLLLEINSFEKIELNLPNGYYFVVIKDIFGVEKTKKIYKL